MTPPEGLRTDLHRSPIHSSRAAAAAAAAGPSAEGRAGCGPSRLHPRESPRPGDQITSDRLRANHSSSLSFTCDAGGGTAGASGPRPRTTANAARHKTLSLLNTFPCSSVFISVSCAAHDKASPPSVAQERGGRGGPGTGFPAPGPKRRLAGRAR